MVGPQQLEFAGLLCEYTYSKVLAPFPYPTWPGKRLGRVANKTLYRVWFIKIFQHNNSHANDKNFPIYSIQHICAQMHHTLAYTQPYTTYAHTHTHAAHTHTACTYTSLIPHACKYTQIHTHATQYTHQHHLSIHRDATCTHTHHHMHPTQHHLPVCRDATYTHTHTHMPHNKHTPHSHTHTQ